MSVNALSLHDVYNVDSTTLVSYDTRLYECGDRAMCGK